MAKVFTITAGVENMGALKTGGQGSVYKGKRIGEIITAIKILPTPIYSESGDDKNFVSFQNEVEKLKKVNEDANANVVSILSAGITDSGNFPFIEMEYIDGPDLAELLKPPHDIIFTIHEALKVAEHLSNAIAHCHKADVKHGDIKSNNVKYNVRTGNYVLLDFGLSVMSDEQRRTSLRQAGAIEFMAPEQSEGQLFFETEIYSFGVILFELLSGTVPFTLRDNGESARNTVMVAHLETLPPNLLLLRQNNLPKHWSTDKRKNEMQLPEWLLSMVYKCLEKDPKNRFLNGMQLHEYIVRNSILAAGNLTWGADRITKLELENEDLLKEKKELLQKINSLQNHSLVIDSSNKNNLAAQNNSGSSKLFTVKNILLLLFLLTTIGLITERFIAPQKPVVKQIIPLQKVKLTHPTEQENSQLKQAHDFLLNGRVEEARQIYKNLADQQLPEAMYEYGNLTLLNETDKATCLDAINYLQKAANQGYIPAKRTAGFLYAFATDATVLKQKGYSECRFPFNVPRGSILLMEAALNGDKDASVLLDKLNKKYSNQ